MHIHLKNYHYKYSNQPDSYEKDFHSFQLEYLHMKSLQNLMEKNETAPSYSRFFPYYQSIGKIGGSIPYIQMEHLNGITLEDLLNKNTTAYYKPSCFLTPACVLHIFEQLHDAIYWLYQGGMMPIDLSPQNILVLNDKFDIKLIDFTDCYYIRRPDRPYKKTDYRIDPALPIGMQLRDAAALLFTRLFFCGKTHYHQQFSIQNAENIFEKKYHSLLHCLMYPTSIQHHLSDVDDLFYWEDWYEQFVSVLQKP